MSISLRYSNIVSNFNEYTYHLLGCGAIGSSAATQLVRMGAENLKLYDLDTVSEENIGVSMYNTLYLGKHKTNALEIICKHIGGDHINIECINGKFKECYSGGEGKDIVILGFDNMSSRLDAVKTILKSGDIPFLLIDGRMGAEHYQQYTFTKPKLSDYMKYWYSDEDGDEDPCNAKATSYCSNMSGSFICNTIRKVLTKQPYHKQMSFDFPTMMLQTNGYQKIN